VSDFGMALKQSGLVAAQMGVSLEETTGTLAAFASAGLLGSDAGTSLKTMLLRLANPSKEAAEAMEQFGISGL
jgi:TP901 family phage tail tape measure protein